MSDQGGFRTEQEAFWAGAFGTEYISRNRSDQLLASNLQFFSRSLSRTDGIGTCVELGANIGMNLRAIRYLYPNIALSAVEINSDAAQLLEGVVDREHIFNQSILDWAPTTKYDLSFTKGVLIHINPDELPTVYDRLYQASRRFILVAEYYNPSPVAIPYRGNMGRLFKRDFAGEMMDRFTDLRLIDYGFSYRRDPAFPQDDITWFLMEKVNSPI